MRRELLKKPHVLICSAEFLASDEVIHVQIRFFMEALRKEIPDYLGIFPKHRTPLYGTPRSKKKKGLCVNFGMLFR